MSSRRVYVHAHSLQQVCLSDRCAGEEILSALIGVGVKKRLFNRLVQDGQMLLGLPEDRLDAIRRRIVDLDGTNLTRTLRRLHHYPALHGRTRSNTPLAALITLNNDTFVEASQALAKRVIEETPGADDEARIDHAFQLCLARKPAEAARDRLDSLLETSRAWYRQHSDEAKAFTGTGAIEGVPAEETAAWVATLRVLLNLDEFLTRS